MHWMLLPLRRYFDFSGRSRRMEFWMFQLFMTVTNIALLMIVAAGVPWAEVQAMPSSMDMPIGQEPQGTQDMFAAFGLVSWLGLALMVLWGLFFFIPSLAVTVRRLHDRDMSGWWYGGPLLVSFIPLIGVVALPVFLFVLVMMFLPGTSGPNRYGPDPKDPSQADVFV